MSVSGEEKGVCTEAAHCWIAAQFCQHKLPHTAKECDGFYTPTTCPYPGAYCTCFHVAAQKVSV
jgi:hypothetical protein